MGESFFVFCMRTGQKHRGVDCVRQAIVIRCQKVGIGALGHKTHRGEREDRTQAQAHTSTLPESWAEWAGQR